MNDGEVAAFILGAVELAEVFAEGCSIRADADGDGCADFAAPVGLAGEGVDGAAIAEEAGLHFAGGLGEDDGVMLEWGIDVAKGWEEMGEEFVGGALGELERVFAPEVLVGGDGLVQSWEGVGGAGGGDERDQ